MHYETSNSGTGGCQAQWVTRESPKRCERVLRLAAVRNARTGAAAGLTSPPDQSGEKSRGEQEINKAGSRHFQAVAIELAWGWRPYQPRSRLSRWYQTCFGRGGRALARWGLWPWPGSCSLRCGDSWSSA
jgi:hypothetical protein